jgi:hypothetical protein
MPFSAPSLLSEWPDIGCSGLRMSAFESGGKNTVLNNPRLPAMGECGSSVVAGQKFRHELGCASGQ